MTIILAFFNFLGIVVVKFVSTSDKEELHNLYHWLSKFALISSVIITVALIEDSLPKEIIKEFQKPKLKKVHEPGDTSIAVRNYFSQKKAVIIEEKILRKNSELEYLVEIPSSVGKVKFFVKYRNKKVITDADLVLAHNDAQLRKLPLLFLSSGDLNKKAIEYASKHFMIFEKL